MDIYLYHEGGMSVIFDGDEWAGEGGSICVGGCGCGCGVGLDCFHDCSSKVKRVEPWPHDDVQK